MLERLKAIIVNYVEVKEDAITPESRFMEDLGFTSFDFMSMLGELRTSSTWRWTSRRQRGSAR